MLTGSGASSVKRTAEPAALLQQGLRELGLDDALRAPLLAFLDELVRWNGAYNLTAVRDPSDMVTRHLLDSLAVLTQAAVLPGSGGHLVDVGSGPGLPGIPLALARPDWQVTVLDGNGKKARFLRHAQRTLGLHNLRVIEGRCDDWTPATPAAAVISRAFASLADFVRLTAHLLQPGGHWLAMKGRVDENEIRALAGLAQLEAVLPLRVPGLSEQRHLVVASPLSPHPPPS